MSTTPSRLARAAALLLACLPIRGATAPPALEITANTTLDPSKVYGPIVVKASSITIDGRGAWLVGATGGSPRDFKGTALTANHVSNVTLKNLNAKGWETGLKVSDAAGWTVENCNFSDNFHDPAFGWGENGRRGGIVLERVSGFTLRKNKANRDWDACVLVHSDDNRIETNDFSHTSNTCLKLWKSSRNRVERNILSHGLRINPGEVHARDSTCVLIESGSNDNRFVGNDCTHGGDGIFVRVLNGWVSTGNVFKENDCSYANNNGFEAWSPRNVYLRNRANHCSYGFWLGASDQTRLEGNEASYNGDPKGFHNSPHLPGGSHAGIVFMFGPSSHTIARGNTCQGNHGAGIAAIGDLEPAGPKWKAYHWIIEGNRLIDNRWGLYLQRADWLDIAGNTFRNNTAGDVHQVDVTRLTEHPSLPGLIDDPPHVLLKGPERAKVGEAVTLDASGSTDPRGRSLDYRWDLGDGSTSLHSRVSHVFTSPGFKRLGLTVNNDSLSDLAWRDLYVVDDVSELGTEGQAKQWGWIDPRSRVTFSDDTAVQISGRSALFALVDPYGGERVSLLYPATRQAGWSLKDHSRLVFWVKVVNENVPAWQGPNPLITLYESAGRSVVLTPKADFLSQPFHNEEREGWRRFEVPLAGDEQWVREGPALATVNYLTIGFDSWGAPPLRIWIDGLYFQ